MTITISEKTKQSSRQLMYHEHGDKFMDVDIRSLELIFPKEGRSLPVSIWFVHENVLYEFLTPQKYTKEGYQILIKLAKRYSSFKVYVQSRDNIAFLKFVESCRAPLHKKQAEQSLKETIDHVKQKANSVLKALPDMNITPAVAQASKDVVEQVVNTVMKEEKIVTTLSRLLDIDGRYLDHAVAVSMISTAIGKQLNLPANALEALSTGGLMHDIGESKLPSRVLGPDVDLDGDDFLLLQKHTVYGQEILDQLTAKGLDLPPEVEIVALQHHEKFNGCGYPNNKKGRQEEQGPSGIHLYARIVAVADRYVEFIEQSRDNKKITQAQILARMSKQDGSFDPVILKKFQEIVKGEI